ncbi:MAG TPA: Trp biosynthesis-associated membrane protein [Cellulomonas sp.]|nr:Trp biosynthesis-associated membrane protein [Cellulomonas sp.]
MMRRARVLSVSALLLAGAIGIISSTQTWLEATLRAGGDPLPVPGAAAIPVLAPLSLAVLALGGALSIVGVVLRYVFAVLSVLAGGILLWLTGTVLFTRPTSSVASTVTTATGISGQEGVARLVADITPTAWPAVTLVAWVLLLAGGIFTLVTARIWRRVGRRYDTETAAAHRTTDGPVDAVDSWDELSRGEDPTAPPSAPARGADEP